MEEAKIISVGWNSNIEASNTKHGPGPVENNKDKSKSIENNKSDDSKDMQVRDTDYLKKIEEIARSEKTRGDILTKVMII